MTRRFPRLAAALLGTLSAPLVATLALAQPPKTSANVLEKRLEKEDARAEKAQDRAFEKSLEKSFEKSSERSYELRKPDGLAPLPYEARIATTLATSKLAGFSTGWYQGDPADSAYRAAYSYFGRQEYRAAADRFNDVRAKYPSSRYFCDAAYYEAFARYRLGTPNDLRTGARVLDGMGNRCADGARREDVPELAARIDGVLARLGDNDAADRVRRAASQGARVCDREERNVKIQALSALAQMDPDGAKPILSKVLDQRDDCSAPVRREALQLVARSSDPGAIALLAKAARTDPDWDTQYAATDALTRVGTDAAYNALEELLRASSDERVQLAAARALGQSDNARAQSIVRTLAERKDVSERMRVAIIGALGGRGTTGTDYWRSLYGKVESDDLRRAIVGAVNRNSDDGQQFLLSIARNASEPSYVRALALSRIQQTVPIAELYRIFETADSRSLRQSVVSSLSARKEPEATDRLIDIAKRGTDPEVRQSAIRSLGQPGRRDDPKVRKALADILGGQS